MFIKDNPIKTSDEDVLERKKYAEHLGQRIIDWRGEESIVIALNGAWGEGKTSIVNMVIEYIENIEKAEINRNFATDEKFNTIKRFKKCFIKEDSILKPTIVKYNPWTYSEYNDLTHQFFLEIANELKLKSQTPKDKEIAKKLTKYASILNILPTKVEIMSSANATIFILGILGISLSGLIDLFSISESLVRTIFSFLGYLLVILGFVKEIISKLSNYYNQKNTSGKTAIEFKEELRGKLKEREKPLLVIIDDIDRLTSQEVKEMFRLIKINADFPNTIYLIPFDRRIVIENLNKSLGVSGSDYLEKIIQVQFDIPKLRKTEIDKYLFTNLDKLINKMPSVEEHFSQDYWATIYNSGLKHFFKNLRQVKRYISSLEFNISQLYNNGVLEVNPVDFFTIEAIRLFEPNFYNFIKEHNELFTGGEADLSGSLSREMEARKAVLNQGLNMLSDEHKEPTSKIVTNLFPKVAVLIDERNSIFGSDWYQQWNINLRICTPTHFNSYFAYLPKGSSLEVSEYDLQIFYKASSNKDDFETVLQMYIKNNKISKLLDLMGDHTKDNHKIPQKDLKNIVIPLINLTDCLISERKHVFDRYPKYAGVRLVYWLLNREKDMVLNFSLVKDVINEAKSLDGPTHLISLVTSANDNGRPQSEKVITDEGAVFLKQYYVKRVSSLIKDMSILQEDNASNILYSWMQWGDQTSSLLLKKFLEDIFNEDKFVLDFLLLFKKRTFINSFDGSASATRQRIIFDFEAISLYLEDIKRWKDRVRNIDVRNLEEKHKEIVGLFVSEEIVD